MDSLSCPGTSGTFLPPHPQKECAWGSEPGLWLLTLPLHLGLVWLVQLDWHCAHIASEPNGDTP